MIITGGAVTQTGSRGRGGIRTPLISHIVLEFDTAYAWTLFTHTGTQ